MIDQNGSRINSLPPNPKDLGKVHCLKGPSQPHLCFCLHVRVAITGIFYLEHVKTKEITVLIILSETQLTVER